MKVLILLIAFVVIIILLEIFKHRMGKSFSQILLYLVIGVILLLVAAAYVDLSEFFSPDNSFTQTGAAVVDAFKDNVDLPSWDEIEIFEEVKEEAEEFVDKNIEE